MFGRFAPTHSEVGLRRRTCMGEEGPSTASLIENDRPATASLGATAEMVTRRMANHGPIEPMARSPAANASSTVSHPAPVVREAMRNAVASAPMAYTPRVGRTRTRLLPTGNGDGAEHVVHDRSRSGHVGPS